MKQLDYRDFLFINNMVYMVNETQDFDEMRRKLLMFIREHIPCNVTTFYLTDETGEHITADPIGIGEITDEILQSYISDSEKDDYMKIFMLTGGNQVIRHSDLFEEKTLLEMQRSVFRVSRPRYAMTTFMFYKEEFMGIISMYRNDKANDFTDREISIMEVLSRHIALRIYQKKSNDRMHEDHRKLKIIEIGQKHSLSKREQTVLTRIYMGESPTQIAEELFISESTVKNHMAAIYKKLGIHARNQLFRMIL